MKLRYYILALVLLLAAFATKAATTYTVYNVPPLRLSVGISGSQTTGIKLSAPIRNGESVTFPALTGGILQLKNARFDEYVYYGSATINYSTLEVTLAGVVRGYCWNNNTFASCEAGRTWAKGTEATLVNDMRLFNFSMKKDLVNTTNGSGAILCGSTVNPCMFQGRYTTAQRDAFTWKGGAGEGTPIIHNTTTGTLEWWDGGAWNTIGDTGTSNGSETVAGKFEAASFTEVGNLTLTGSTTALVVLTPRHLTKNGSGSTVANRIPLLNLNGVIPVTMGGTGTGGTVGVLSGAILLYQGTSTPRSLKPTAANQVLTTNDGRTPFFGTPNFSPNTVASITTPVHRNDSSLTGSLLSFTITGGTIRVGTTYEIVASGTGSFDSGNGRLFFGLGSASGTLTTATSTFANYPWNTRVKITFLTTGVSAKYILWSETAGLNTAYTSFSPITLYTVPNTANNITMKLYFGRLGAGTSAMSLYNAYIQKFN